MFTFKNQLSYVKTDWKIVIENILKIYELDSKLKKQITKLTNKINNVNMDILYPPLPLIFHSFNIFDYQKLRIVIIGQDPYHQKGQAMGLSFSIDNTKITKIPPTLKNIFKELKDDLNIDRTNTNLSDWAKQGVLLLNSSLTVEHGKPNSHQKCWEFFTDNIIETISNDHENIVFLLWGNHAKSKKSLIDCEKHHILESVHPSPLSAHRGWFGCKHFSLVNDFLKSKNKSEIKW